MPEDEDNLLQEDESLTPEEHVEHRLEMASRLEDVARAMYRLSDYWQRFNLPGDFLDAEAGEYPFELDLEEMQLQVEEAVIVIRENIDRVTTPED